MKQLWIDTETGGLNPQKHALLQIAAIIVIEGEVMQVHGIEDPFAEDRHAPHEAYRILVDNLGRYVDKFKPADKFQFFGFNARFDADFTRQFFVKNGDKYFGSWCYFPPIDIMQWAALMWMNERDTMKKFTLQACCQKAGIEWNEEEAHDALYDIKKTRELATFIDNHHALGVF